MGIGEYGMDFLEMVLQCTLLKILEISDQCADPAAQEKLDNLYDETVGQLAAIKKSKLWKSPMQGGKTLC